MGLDMFMLAHKDETNESTEIGYWRKHNALHAWFEDRFRQLNPDFQEAFNCVPFPMTTEILDDLETSIKNNDLKPRERFFWGSTNYNPAEDAPYDLEIVAKAREYLTQGYQVAYDSWW